MQQCTSTMDGTGSAVGLAVLSLEAPCFFFLVGPEGAAARPASGVRPLVNALSIASPAAVETQASQSQIQSMLDSQCKMF